MLTTRNQPIVLALKTPFAMHVAIIHRQKIIKVQTKQVRQLVEFFLKQAGMHKNIEWDEVSVVLVDDIGSRDINKLHLGHDYATDVISFNFDPIPGVTSSGACGEIVVNVEQARRMGNRFNGFDHELALYLAHGCDHLSGEDDATLTQRRSMRRRELRWLKQVKTSGLSKRGSVYI